MSEYFHWQEYGDRQPFDTLDEAVEDFLEDFVDPAGWPKTVEIHGYSTKQIPVQDPQWLRRWAETIAENLWESLEDEFGNSEESTEMPDQVVVLAKQFLVDSSALFDDRNIWPDGTSETVDVREWVLANRPDWLKDLTPTVQDGTVQTATGEQHDSTEVSHGVGNPGPA